MDTYVCDAYIASVDTAKNVLEKFGVAIVPNVLSEEECEAMNAGMWDTLETITSSFTDPLLPVRRDDPSTWVNFLSLVPLHSMLVQHWQVGHAQYVWDIRQNANVADVFATIWDCSRNDLLVSFDGVSYHMPFETTNRGWYRKNDWLHTDQSFLVPHFACAQGWVTGYDVRPGDATLMFLEGSHLHHEACQREFNITKNTNWNKLTPEQCDFYTQQCHCPLRRIACPRGSLVLWDSRTVHCGTEPMRERAAPNFRNVAYVCYQPRSHASDASLRKKQSAFENMRMTNHWPANFKLFPKAPNTYGRKLPAVTELPTPQITAFGRRLAGFD